MVFPKGIKRGRVAVTWIIREHVIVRKTINDGCDKMPAIFSVNSNAPCKIDVHLKIYERKEEKEMPHGWGIALYRDKIPFILREAITSPISELMAFLENYPSLESKILVTHVRFMTTGGVTLEDTHPFSRELFGERWVFVHSGTVREYENIPLKYYYPIGKTDSEHIFCHIMDNIRDLGQNPEIDALVAVFKRILPPLTKKGTLNFVLTNGSITIVFKSARASPLYYGKRKLEPNVSLTYGDTDLEVTLTNSQSETINTFVISSTEMGRKDWALMDPNQLFIIKHGELEALETIK